MDAGYRYTGCEITDEEKRYIANDVLVVKEAIEMMDMNNTPHDMCKGCFVQKKDGEIRHL